MADRWINPDNGSAQDGQSRSTGFVSGTAAKASGLVVAGDRLIYAKNTRVWESDGLEWDVANLSHVVEDDGEIDIDWAVRNTGSWLELDNTGTFTVWSQGSITTEPDYVTWDYQQGSGSSAGLMIGALPKVSAGDQATAIAALKLAPGWWRNSGTNTLLVSLPGNENPNTGADLDLIYPLTDDALAFTGAAPNMTGTFRLHRACGVSGGNYWTSRFGATTGGHIEGVEFHWSGYHAMGSNGAQSSGHRYVNILCAGMVRGHDSAVVDYTSSTQLSDNVWRDLTVRLAELRDFDGDPLGESGDLIGLAGHTNGTATFAANGQTFIRPRVQTYAADESATDKVRSCAFSGTNASAVADRDDSSLYAILIRDGEFADFGFLNASSANGDVSVAVQRCKVNSDGTTSNGAGENAAINLVAGELLFESSVISAEMSSTANHVLGRFGDKMTFSNCTCCGRGSISGMFFIESGGDFKATHSVWVTESDRWFRGNNAGTIAVDHNRWDQNFTSWGTHTDHNSQAKWAAMDTNGVFGIDFSGEFDSYTNLSPVKGGDLDTNTAAGNPDTPVGIYGHEYANHAGAHQLISPTPAHI